MKYKEIGLKCGLEIHQQIDTKHKLFCRCFSGLSGEKPSLTITRKLRAVAGELGEIDIAAVHESLKNQEFDYYLYIKESCEVEADEDPPREINREALGIALRVAKKLNCMIPDEIYVMRKHVLDGSNTTGFQRTALIGVNGWVETKEGRIGIENVSLEEESAKIIRKGKKVSVFGLDRLGIPLIEIGTSPDIKTPEQAKEVAEKIGMVLRETGKVKRGIGTIRQDLNVSITGGSRVEIKGVQELKMIPKIIEKEVKRQQRIIKQGRKVPKEVRKANEDGTTSFLRPLPGAARLYPETDIPPVRITPEIIGKAGEKTEEEMERERHAGFLASLGMTIEKATEMIIKGHVKKEHVETAERLSRDFPSLDKKLVWKVVTEVPKDIKTRRKAKTENLREDHFREVLKKLENGEISKEAVPDILDEFAKNPDEHIEKIMKKLGIAPLTVENLREIIRKTIYMNPAAMEMPKPEKALMGLVMKEARGRIPGEVVIKTLMEEIEKARKKR